MITVAIVPRHHSRLVIANRRLRLERRGSEETLHEQQQDEESLFFRKKKNRVCCNKEENSVVNIYFKKNFVFVLELVINEGTVRDVDTSLERRGLNRTGDAARYNDLKGQAVANEGAMRSVRLNSTTRTKLHVKIRI